MATTASTGTFNTPDNTQYPYICKASIWNADRSGSWTDSQNYVSEVLPSPAHVAVFGSNDSAPTITVDDADVAVGFIVVKSGWVDVPGFTYVNISHLTHYTLFHFQN